MPRVERSIYIAAPPHRVWEVVTDPLLAPRWNRNVVEICDVSDTPVRAGSTWTQIVVILGRKTTMRARIVEFDPPHTGLIELAGPASGRITTRVEAAEGGSRVHQAMEFSVPGGPLGQLAAAAAEPTVTRELDESLRRQKQMLEEG